ncbi:MAG: flagellar hook-length control protein FliK [Phycisphaeraceae bacterium]|nr:flagellar hook-length control protein FliK [Phycisphaeraceae bacterium]
MTASASSLSSQAVTSSSAIHARANLQSAAIGLFGAGTSSPGEDGGSFAQSLESESRRQSTPQGIFSDGAESAKSTPDRSRPKNASKNELPSDSRRPENEDDPTRRAPEQSDRPLAEASDSRHDDSLLCASRQPDSTLRAPTGEAAAPTVAAIAAHSAAQDSPPTDPAPDAATPDQSKAAASESKPRQPSDPLRLITPNQQPAVEDAPLASQSSAVQAAGETDISQNANSKQTVARLNENSIRSAGTKSSSTIAPNSGIASPSAAGVTNAASVGPSTGSTLNVGATAGATGGGSQVTAPIDQVSPPKTGGGRLIEQPVTLKLKTTPANGSQPLSEAEITAVETQIGRGLTAAFRQNTPQVTLWMSPESLGKVRIQLTFDQGTISARFEATSEATKDLLAQNMSALRDALQSRGLTAQHIEVVSIPDWSQQNGSQSGSGEGRSNGGDLSQQGTNNGNSSSGQGGQSQQGQTGHSREWSRLMEGSTQHESVASSEAQISLAIEPRLLSLKAHLELDAVA